MTKYLPLNRVIPVMILYCIVTVIGMLHHELWLDDVQHFLMARDSKSLLNVFSSDTYDDHVGLWKLFLFYLTHFISDAPIAIQLLHLVVINCTVFVFLRYAPINFVIKVLIVFGYYFIFEYSLLCRSYALGLLFLFMACALLTRPDKNIIGIGVMLALMSNTHEFFAVAAFGIFLYLLIYNYERKSLNWRFLVFTCLFVAGGVVAGLHVAGVASDNYSMQTIHRSWLTVHNISFAIHGIDKGFIPFPSLHDPNCWNRHFFESWPSIVKVPVSILFLFFPIWVLRNSRKALIFYVVSSLFLLLFLTMTQMSATRHYGMFFIYFVTAIWLADNDGANVLFTDKTRPTSPIDRSAMAIFYMVLIGQFFAGVYMYQQDYCRPFSQGKNTVAFIQQQHLDSYPVVIDGYNAGPALSAYFRHPLYYLDIDTIGSYFSEKSSSAVTQRRSLIQEINSSTYIAQLKEFILITNREPSAKEINTLSAFNFNKLQCFEHGIIISENYCVFKVTKKKNS